MSYSIIKSISQKSLGVFRISVACSNVYPRNFCEPYDNDYFLRLYPNLNKAQYEAMMLLRDTYNGTVFYPAVWKAKLEIVYDLLMPKKQAAKKSLK